MTNFYSSLSAAFSPYLDSPFLSLPGGAVWTYRALDHRVARMAGALKGFGIVPGDRVMAQVDKSTDAIALYLACLRTAAVYLPLNTAYTLQEVRYFAADASPAVIIARPGTLEGLAPTVAGLGTSGDGSFAEAADVAEPFTGVVDRAPSDLAALLYTSGTTGDSKGAELTHGGLLANAEALHALWRFGPGDVLLHALPTFHIHGLFVAMHCAMLAGAEVIFLPRFDPAAVVAHLPKATVMMGVPTHYTRLLNHPGFDTAAASLRLFTSGSAPMTEVVHEAFTARTGHRILERYGMTEAGIITSNPYEGARVPGTVGFPIPGVDVRVADPKGEELPPGVTGGVEIRSPGLFSGYWRQPGPTAASFRAGGWFITGDVGALDEEGRLTLEGRSSDMIISGGLNVYPREVERVLDTLPGVREACVIGVPHPDFGEAVVAVVVRDRGREVSEGDLSAALEGVLARFKHPKRYVWAEALPRNSMAKVIKAGIRAENKDLFTA